VRAESASAAQHAPFFHVGILVRDIDQAIDDFGRLLGVRFEPVRTGTVVSGEQNRYCYSLAGPPMLELVEMVGDGTWSPSQGEGLHHIGYGRPDVPGQCAVFGGQADTLVAAGDGQPRVIFTRPAALHGVRVEYLESTMVAATMRRLREMAEGQ
jgi:catechol 2,3-dioxygenase-like lactoylglutathione lyase family enzyme